MKCLVHLALVFASNAKKIQTDLEGMEMDRPEAHVQVNVAVLLVLLQLATFIIPIEIGPAVLILL